MLQLSVDAVDTPDIEGGRSKTQDFARWSVLANRACVVRAVR